MDYKKINLDKKQNETHSSHNTKIKVLLIKVVITVESGRTEHKESLSVKTNETENASGRRKKYPHFRCSGLSNTGKLTMQTASAVAFRRPDTYRAMAAQKGVDDLRIQYLEAFEF